MLPLRPATPAYTCAECHVLIFLEILRYASSTTQVTNSQNCLENVVLEYVSSKGVDGSGSILRGLLEGVLPEGSGHLLSLEGLLADLHGGLESAEHERMSALDELACEGNMSARTNNQKFSESNSPVTAPGTDQKECSRKEEVAELTGGTTGGCDRSGDLAANGESAAVALAAVGIRDLQCVFPCKKT
jgi:hypothetical protein